MGTFGGVPLGGVSENVPIGRDFEHAVEGRVHFCAEWEYFAESMSRASPKRFPLNANLNMREMVVFIFAADGNVSWGSAWRRIGKHSHSPRF